MARKIFEKVRMNSPRKSAFDLSHENKLSMDMGELVPCYLEEVMPGDEFKVRSEVMIRLAPMLAPVMHRVNVFVHYFFVPNRIVWNQWEDFITGGREGTSSPIMPVRTVDSIAANYAANTKGTLADYLGLPSVPDGAYSNAVAVSELPFRAYQQIYNDWYRDPNLTDEVDYSNLTELLTLRKRCWEKDYFTSALPWAQRGTDVGIPVDINYKSISDVKKFSGGSFNDGDNLEVGTGDNLIGDQSGAGVAARIENLQEDEISVNINELRRTSAIQRWLEKQARGGYRYIETLLSQFGVRSKDSRLQRAEYLGGGKQPVVISEVLNTSATATEPQGDMAGHGIAIGGDNKMYKKVDEHGYIIGIISVLPRTSYHQGIPRHFTRTDKYDYPWPEFANLGEQEIKTKEIYYTEAMGSSTDDVWGYQQRYAEFKYKPAEVHGDFRDTLNYWHMGRTFSSKPNLNASFVESDPTLRIFADSSGTNDALWVNIYNSVKARRPLPYFANPQLT